MEVKIIEKKKGSLELKFDSRELPDVLAASLVKKGVDAYAYKVHPLLQDYRLHIDSKDSMDNLKKSLVGVEKDWKDFQKTLKKALKKKK